MSSFTSLFLHFLHVKKRKEKENGVIESRLNSFPNYTRLFSTRYSFSSLNTRPYPNGPELKRVKRPCNKKALVHPDRNPNRTLLYDPSTCTLHSKPNSRPQLSSWHGLRFYHSGTDTDRDRSSSQVIKVTNSYEHEPMMHPLNAVMMTRMLVRNSGLESEGIPFGSIWWFIYAGLSAFFVIFAGIMSGLTLGLMSLGLVDLEILQRSGSPTEKKQAGYRLSLFASQFVAVFLVGR